MSDDLIQEIYASVTAPGRLIEMMTAVGRIVHADSAFLFTSHSASSPEALLLGHNVSNEHINDFATTWRHEDIWAKAAGRRGMMRRNVVVTGDELVPEKELHRSAFYSDYGRRAGMDAMVGTILFDGTERDGAMPFTNLCWYRSPGKDRFTPDDTARLRPLMPHMQRALLLHEQLRQLSMQHLLAGVGASGMQLASLVIDAAARIVAHNASAERVLGGSNALVTTVAGHITALGRRAVPSFHEALHLCKRTGQAVQLVIQEVSGGRLIEGTLSAIAPDTPGYVGMFAQPHFLLIIQCPGAPNMDLVHKACQLYNFTASETAVTVLLLQGLTVAQVAHERDCSLNTVRTQVRAL